MGSNNLPNITAGKILLTHINDIILALKGTIYGRNSSTGSVQSGEDIGSITIPWGDIYANGLNIAGQPINFNLITTSQNRIVSGQLRSTSGQPDFIRADGTILTATIEGAVTDLDLVIEGTQVVFNTDVSLPSLTESPATNHTALVNEAGYTAEDYTKYAGEMTNTINIDTAGTEWDARIGEMIAFKIGISDEIAFGYLKSSTEITNCYRGWFFDNAGEPIIRNTLSDDDTLTLLNLGWVYAHSTGTTGAVGYTTPTISGLEPVAPISGDYWYDLNNEEWMIYSAGNFISANSMLIGAIVNDTTACIASRSFDFDNGYTDLLNIDLAVESAEEVRIDNTNALINVYGNNFFLGYNPLKWNITTDRETGVAETADTMYYLYLTEEGKPVVSDIFPHLRTELLGYYHPYNSWRYVGRMYNNSSSDVDMTLNHEVKNNRKFLISDVNILADVAEIEFLNLGYIPFNLIPIETEIDYLDFEFSVAVIGGEFEMRFSEDNGTTWEGGSTDYYMYSLGTDIGSNGIGAWQARSEGFLADILTNSYKSGLYKIYGLYDKSVYQAFKGHQYTVGDSSPAEIYIRRGSTSSVANAFKVYQHNFDMTAGRIKLYGVMK